jgi:hypothetical protein
MSNFCLQSVRRHSAERHLPDGMCVVVWTGPACRRASMSPARTAAIVKPIVVLFGQLLFALIVCRTALVLSACNVQEYLPQQGTMPFEQSTLEPTTLP